MDGIIIYNIHNLLYNLAYIYSCKLYRPRYYNLQTVTVINLRHLRLLGQWC